MTDQDPPAEAEIYGIVGEAGFRRLVSSFYRQVPLDDLLSPMYPPSELVEAERRLADFLIYRFGGPDDYIQRRGHPRLRMRHVHFRIDQAARDRWVQLMETALAESAFPAAVLPVVRRFLHDSATFLINSHPA